MPIEMEAVKPTLDAIATALRVVKQGKELPSEGGGKRRSWGWNGECGKSLKGAAAESAKAPGYPLCRPHPPPRAVFSTDHPYWKCLVCGNQNDNGREPAAWFSAQG